MVMSTHKVNLSPDDAAREQRRQSQGAASHEGASRPHREQGISNRETPEEEEEERRQHPPVDGEA
jgi:hypothetical protein